MNKTLKEYHAKSNKIYRALNKSKNKQKYILSIFHLIDSVDFYDRLSNIAKEKSYDHFFVDECDNLTMYRTLQETLHEYFNTALFNIKNFNNIGNFTIILANETDKTIIDYSQPIIKALDSMLVEDIVELIKYIEEDYS